VMGKYKVILADPPWRFQTYSEKGRGRCPDGSVGAFHYSTMSLEEIKALPVAEWAAPNCTLFLWGTNPLLPQALEVMAAWGFTYKTKAFCWVKKTKWGKEHIGTGYYTRANPEDCWLGTRGKPKRVSASVRQLIHARVREHSRKPDEIYGRIEELMGDVPRLEMFARQKWPGWDAWGLETEKFNREEN